jgi:hypothetical protein
VKAFSVFLVELNEGSTHSALTKDMSELLRTVQATGRAGALVIKIKVSPATKTNSGQADKVTITADRTLALPKPEQPSDFFWLTEDGETSRNHPRQHDLPLRDIASPQPQSFKEA